MIYRCLLFVLIIQATLAAHGKCNTKKYSGEWVGMIQYNSGHSYYVTLDLSEVGRCQIEGTMIWHDYYNSKLSVEGNLHGDTLILSVTDHIGGIYWDEKENYKFILADSLLIGNAFNPDENTPNSELEFSSLKNLDDGERLRHLESQLIH